MNHDFTQLTIIILGGLVISLLFAYLAAREWQKHEDNEEFRKRFGDQDEDNRRGM